MVNETFVPLEKRHMAVRQGEKVIGFSQEGDWIACFKENSKKDFGFVPLQFYLEFQRQTKSQNVTPRSEMGKSQKLNIPDDAGSIDDAKINEQVRDILTDIYDLVLE